MNERIRKFMEQQGLSSSELADSIGVQRSNVSHVLNGRNNPSFPFIEKLLIKYPKLNAKWLLTGDGEMLEGKPLLPKSLFDLPAETNEQAIKTNKSNAKVTESPITTDKKAKEVVEKELKVQVQTNSKSVEKIIVFYTDQTFQIYHPSR